MTQGPRSAEELLRRGEPAEAARLFLEAGALGRAVDALEAAGRFEEAAQLALDSGDAERALRLASRQDLPLLLSAAESALLLRQGRSPAAVAQLLLQLGRHARAAELLSAIGDRLDAARLYEQVGRRERAAEELCLAGQGARAGQLWERHLADHPDDVRSRISLARLLLEAGREKEAVAHAQAALRLEPARAEALEAAAAGLQRLGLRHAAEALKSRLPAAAASEQMTPARAGGEGRAVAASAKLGPPGAGEGGAVAANGKPAPLETEGEMPPAPGSQAGGLGRIGRYELLEVLGQGASAAVYRALDRWSGQVVALKRMRADLEESPEALRRFLLEARLASRLSHPHIVALLDADEHGRTLALELMEGGTLRSRIEAGAVPLTEARRWILEALDGIGRAHFEGIVHRDLKPSNLLLTRSGVLKIADFGVAHVMDSSWTRSGTVVGTYGYLAPEQLLGQPAQPATDLYALGVVLYEMVSGRPPFTGRDLVHEHLQNPAAWPTRGGRRVSRSLGEALLRLLAKDPLERPATAREAASMLAAADWELEAGEPASEEACEAEPARPEAGLAPAAEEAPLPEERYRLLEEGRDALGWWRRLEDLWLGRRLFERRYEDVSRAAPVLERLQAEAGAPLPVLVRCAAQRGEAAWIEPDLPPASAAELQPLLDEMARAGLEPVTPGLEGLRRHAGRLPDGTVVLLSPDPLIAS
jgi:serine/threonine-protein kinase